MNQRICSFTGLFQFFPKWGIGYHKKSLFRDHNIDYDQKSDYNQLMQEPQKNERKMNTMKKKLVRTFTVLFLIVSSCGFGMSGCSCSPSQREVDYGQSASRRCWYCGKQVNGYKGESVKCRYCGTTNIL